MRLLLLLFLVCSSFCLEKDKLNDAQNFSMFGDTIQVPRTPQVSVQFVYSIDPHDVVTSISGTGSMTKTLAMAELSTGASGSSHSKVNSRDYVIYRPNHETEIAMTAIFPTCVDGNESVVGFGDEEGYVHVGCIGDAISVEHYDGVSQTVTVTQGDWNLDKIMSGEDQYGNKLSRSGFIADWSKMNIFRFTYAWFGIATIRTEIFGGAKYGWIPLHAFDYPNTRTYPHLQNPSVSMVAYTSNTTNTSDVKLYTGSWGASNLGEEVGIGYRHYTFSGEELGVGATETVIACGRSSSSFQGKHNHVPVRIKNIQVAVEGTKIANIKAYINPTIVGGTWTKFKAESSVMDINSTATVSGGEVVGALTLSKEGSDRMIFSNGGFDLNPQESMCITATGGSTDVSVVVFWDELF